MKIFRSESRTRWEERRHHWVVFFSGFYSFFLLGKYSVNQSAGPYAAGKTTPQPSGFSSSFSFFSKNESCWLLRDFYVISVAEG